MPPPPVDTLITHGRIVTVNADNQVIDDGALAITDCRIVAIGRSDEIGGQFTAGRVIDCGGGIVHPGFIDSHIHVSQYTARSVLPRMAGTNVNMGDWKALLGPEDEQASAMLAACDYLQCGYTGFVDPGTIFEPDAVATVSDRTGIRIWLTDPYVADLASRLASHVPELASPDFLARWPVDIEAAIERLGGQLFRNSKPGSRVRAFIGLYGEATASPRLLREASRAAKAAGVRLHMHLGYQPQAYRAEEEAFGGRMLDYLGDNDCLAPHVTFAHMNVVRPEEIELLRKAGIRLVWCPWGQLQAIGLAGAEPRTIEMIRAGIEVGLATDIPRVCNFDALGGMAAAAAAASGTPIADHELLRARTLHAAATIGAEQDLGSIETGKKADLVIRRPDTSEDLGIRTIHETALLLDKSSVRTVLIDGEAVFDNGQLTKVDSGQIAQQARSSARRIATRLGLS